VRHAKSILREYPKQCVTNLHVNIPAHDPSSSRTAKLFAVASFTERHMSQSKQSKAKTIVLVELMYGSNIRSLYIVSAFQLVDDSDVSHS
jgi:hypothetical protein